MQIFYKALIAVGALGFLIAVCNFICSESSNQERLMLQNSMKANPEGDIILTGDYAIIIIRCQKDDDGNDILYGSCCVGCVKPDDPMVDVICNFCFEQLQDRTIFKKDTKERNKNNDFREEEKENQEGGNNIASC